MTYGTTEYWQRQAETLGRQCADLRRRLDDAHDAIRLRSDDPMAAMREEHAEVDRLHALLGDAMRDSLVTLMQEWGAGNQPIDPVGLLRRWNATWQKRRAEAYGQARLNIADRLEAARRAELAAQGPLFEEPAS